MFLKVMSYYIYKNVYVGVDLMYSYLILSISSCRFKRFKNNKSDEQNTKTNNKPIAMDESETQEWQE